MLAGFQYCRFLGESIAITLETSVLRVEAGSTTGTQGVSTSSSAVTAVFLGLQWNPMPGDLSTRALRPFLAPGMGPVFGSSSGTFVAGDEVRAGAESQVPVGGHTGAGVEALLNRRWTLGLAAGYNWVDDFAKPVGGRTDYSGFTVTHCVSGASFVRCVGP
jgi:hypothetical protein